MVIVDVAVVVVAIFLLLFHITTISVLISRINQQRPYDGLARMYKYLCSESVFVFVLSLL